MKTTHSLLTLILLNLFTAFNANANVNPDQSFGTNGIVTTDLFGKEDQIYDIAIQTDGKIVVAGYSVVQSHREFMVMRYLSNGVIDSLFGNNGKATVLVGTANSTARALALQQDGKIVVAGYYDNNFFNDAAVVRFNTNGTIDTTFGNTGVVRLVLSNQFDEFHDVVVQSDNNIILAGRTSQNSTPDFLLIRMQPDGSPDPFFGVNGQVTTDFGGNTDCIYSILLQPDNKILVSGSTNIGSCYFAAARYMDNGTPDVTFGLGGKVQVLSGARLDNCYGMALQADSNIVLVGTHHSGAIDEYMAVRLTKLGVPDNTFGTNGVSVIQASSQSDLLNEVVVEADGRILIAGSMNGGTNMLLQLNSNGLPDVDFGTDGFYEMGAPGAQSALNTLALMNDSSVVAAGFNDNGLDFDFFLSKVFVRSTTSVEDGLSKDLNVIVYPNPVVNEVTVELREEFGKVASVSMFDIDGKLILLTYSDGLGSKINIDMPAGLSHGVYFLKVERGSKQAVKKIVVQ